MREFYPLKMRKSEMKNNGVTLTELLVVIAIVGILVVALGFSFQDWIGRYKVEAQTKQIYFDLMDARARAMQFNRIYLADFPTTTSYRVGEDTNESGAIDAGEPLPTFPKTSEYVLNVFERDDATLITAPRIITNVRINFDKRGLITSTGAAVLFNPATPTTGIISLTSTVGPDYDCIVISSTRINIGRWNAATTNCDAN